MTREQYIDFLEEFRIDLVENKSKWENSTLERFLEAMHAYTEALQGYYDNMDVQIDANEPSWENFKTILQGARVYE